VRKNKRRGSKRKRIFVFAAMVLIPVAVLLLSQRAFAQTTYVITDGSRVMVHTTSATDPEIVLEQAGLALGTNDSYTTHAGDGNPRINVRRGRHVYLDYFGERMEVMSGGETVEELLLRLELTWQEGDIILPSLDARTYDGMKVTIAHTVRESQTYTTALPHETIYCSDVTMPQGTQRVMTEGENGQILCKADVTYLNGIETKRHVLSQQVIVPPVNKVIAVGTGAVPEDTGEESRLPRIADGIITLPTGEVLTYIEKVSCLATAYTCEGYVGTTATGTRARVGAIAVDPEVFPYGTRFYILTKDGEYLYGVATAEDCGSKEFIYGTRLDLYFNTKRECVQFGARSCDVYILG